MPLTLLYVYSYLFLPGQHSSEIILNWSIFITPNSNENV